MHDPELPAGFQDADFEMRELEEAAAHAIYLRDRHGICPHWSQVGYLVPAVYPEQEGLRPGESRCRDCGEVLTRETGAHL